MTDALVQVAVLTYVEPADGGWLVHGPGTSGRSPTSHCGTQSLTWWTAEAAVIADATYYNYHRLHGQLGWQTPAERFEGTLFTDRGFEHVPALTAVASVPAI